MDTFKAYETQQQLKKETHFYSKLQKRIMLEKDLLHEHLDTLNQAVYIDFRVIQKYLVGFNLNDEEEQEKTSNLQTQHHQVSETARGLKLATSQKEHPLQDELPPSQENEIPTEQEEIEILTEQNEILTEQEEIEILTEQENEILSEQEERLAMTQFLCSQIASEKEKINCLRAEISEIQSRQQHGHSETEEYSSDSESDSKDEEELQVILEDLQRQNEELVIKNDHLNQAVHEERKAMIEL
ncbi:uncharacterized protein LOC143434468 [Arvicanthis niloticus]|uniref:uncharacterized protein LOC143308911 n=1 Tax=Arvicanthis niloticus TaxID=61156 RepID=UPI00402B74EA